jgi:uncharacterized phage protein (TIGR01671 family)
MGGGVGNMEEDDGVSREIKFRAWDKEEKQMIYPQNFIEHNGDFSGEAYEQVIPAWSMQETSERIFLQFTGLLDKNGKEIYEGDVVKQYAGRVYETVMTVIWLADEFHTGWYLSQRLELGADRAKTLEVIGNIFEPPDDKPEP